MGELLVSHEIRTGKIATGPTLELMRPKKSHRKNPTSCELIKASHSVDYFHKRLGEGNVGQNVVMFP